MHSEKSSVLLSNDLQSTQSGYNGINCQISQIPGLSSTISTLPEERARGRRAGVLESDSDYVKLAKQGGHKGLLWHDGDTITSKPNSYKPPDWFWTASECDTKPSLINSEEKNMGAFQPRDPPFGTDNMSAWERDDSSSNGKEKNNNVPYNQMEPLQSSKESGKFKRIVFDKKSPPVNMSKLLSFGYAEGDKPIASTDLSN